MGLAPGTRLSLEIDQLATDTEAASMRNWYLGQTRQYTPLQACTRVIERAAASISDGAGLKWSMSKTGRAKHRWTNQETVAAGFRVSSLESRVPYG